MGTSNLIGMALGAFVWGTIADTIGRKKAFTATLLIFSVFTVLGAFSPDFIWFVAFRFLAGFGLGGCIPVDYALVGEFTPRKQRGKVLTAMDGWWPIGRGPGGFVSAGLVALNGGLAPDHAGHGAARTAGVLDPAQRPGVAAVPDPQGQPRGSRQGHRRAGGGHRRRSPGLQPARTAGRTAAFRRQRLDAAARPLWQFNWKITTAAWALFFSILLVYYLSLTWMPRILIGAGFEEYKAFVTTASMAAVGLLGVVVAALLVERVRTQVDPCHHRARCPH